MNDSTCFQLFDSFAELIVLFRDLLIGLFCNHRRFKSSSNDKSNIIKKKLTFVKLVSSQIANKYE